jgi:uncharacterized protein (TIGR03066 family)
MRILSMAAGALVVLACTTFAAAADNKKLLVGKWEVVKADEGTLPVGSVVEFMADGKLKIKIKAVIAAKKDGKETKKDDIITVDGTYTVDGDSFTYKAAVGKDEKTSKITIKKISETELDTVNSDKKNVSLKRVK